MNFNKDLSFYLSIYQFGFLSGKSALDAIFVLRQFQEKFGSKKKELFLVFFDLEKAFDRVLREAIDGP